METLFGIFGGIGMFLLGMSLMTEGLKDFAGDSLRTALLRFTSVSWKGFLSGAMATAVVQSSSATTVMVIGFVSAGMMTFQQALSVVLGASLGTTATSWIVAWIGLKIKVGMYALPVLGVGAFCRVMGTGRWRPLGLSLAGFALIFIAIDILQQGMASLTNLINFSELQLTGIGGSVVAIIVGIFLTVIMQSSSAAIATTLTALSVAAISFEQAAALVIGASIGTTVTGGLASIGGNSPARRTAIGHILFNLATGGVAIVLLPLLLAVVYWFQDRFEWQADATGLALFHTLFVGIGALMFIPFLSRFGAFVERIVPDSGPQLTQYLDQSLTGTPAVALAASSSALTQTLLEEIRLFEAGLRSNRWNQSTAEIKMAVEEIQNFLGAIHAVPDDVVLSQNRASQLHANDHLTRLGSRLKVKLSIQQTIASGELSSAVIDLLELLEMAKNGMTDATGTEWLDAMHAKSKKLQQTRTEQRTQIIQRTAQGRHLASKALDLLDSSRWIERVGYHVWRCCFHLIEPDRLLEKQPNPKNAIERPTL